MTVYWLSFRINADAGYDETYSNLADTIRSSVSGKWWYETTSFYIFESAISLDTLAQYIKMAIRADRDLAVLGMTSFDGGRVIGKCDDQDIFRLVQTMKKV